MKPVSLNPRVLMVPVSGGERRGVGHIVFGFPAALPVAYVNVPTQGRVKMRVLVKWPSIVEGQPALVISIPKVETM